MKPKPQYLIDTYWLAGNPKPQWVVWVEYSLYAIAGGIALWLLYLYFTADGFSFRFWLPFAIIGLAQVGIRYLFSRKQVGHIRFTTENIILNGPEKRKIPIENLGSLRIEFDFDRTRAHKLWMSSEIGGKEDFVLFKFINSDDFRKFNNLIEMLNKMGIELTSETRISLDNFSKVMNSIR